MADNRLQLGITISADGKAAEQALERVKGKLGQVSRSTTDMAAAANLARSAFSAMAATLSARELIRTADAYAGMQARLKLVSGSTKEFLTAQTELFRISQQNLAPLGETVTLYTKLSTSIRDMGKSQADALQVTDLVAKTLRISGASAQESAAALLQFGQALGSGVLQGDELRSILESSPRLARALAEGLGVATGQLKAMGAAGELSSRKVVEALQSQASTIKAEYTKLPLTVSSAWQQMENAATKYIGQTDQAAGSSRKLAEALSLVANNLEAIADPLATVVGTITKVEIGGWLQFRDILDGIKTNLKEMVGLKDAGTVDPEVQRLIAMGQGQVPVADLAAATESQAQYFDGVKRGANDALLAVTKLSDAQKAVASMVIDTARANKVDPAWALAIAQQESGFNQLAKSAAGAQGVMQLMPSTAKQLGVNIADVNDNIKGGVIYLKQQQEQFKSLKLASAAYNAGPGNVQKYGGVPPFKETQNYVQSVGAMYQKWQQVLGAQGTAFVSAKDQADELKTAYESLKTHQDGMVSAAENFAKVQTEKIKTSLAALEAERKAAQDVTAAQLASAQTYDDKQRLLAAAAQAQEQYHQKAMALTQQEFDAQQQAIEARKQALQDELAGADKYNLTIIEQAKLKQAIASADSDLAVLAQQRAQAEIAAGQQVNEASQQALALKQQEQNAIGGVIAEYERQVEILNRLTQAQQAGASAELLGRLNQVYQQSGGLPEIVSPEQIQRLQEVLLKTTAVKDAIQEMTKATLDQGKAEQAVREEQLRQNAYWEQMISRMEEYAQTWKEITGVQHDAFSEITLAFWKMTQSMEQVGNRYDAMQEKFQASHGGETSDILGVASGVAQAEAALNGMARTLLAIRNQYEEGSQGYKDMTAAAERMMEVQRALSAIEAVLGVIHQFTSGDVYTAIPRAIGVAAMMASLGYQVGLGGGSTAKAEYRAQPGQTGTVFGDATAQSESISKSLEIIRDNTSNDLNYSAAMLRSLENIESALAGATNAIIRGVGPSVPVGTKLGSLANAGMLDIGGMDFAAQMIGKFVFNVQREISDFGIQVLPHTIKKMFQNGFQAASYTDVTTTTKLLGISVSQSTHSYFSQLNDEVNRQFTGVITNIAKTVKVAGEALGVSGYELTSRLDKFVIDIGRVSLANLKGEELQKKLEEMFSTMSDQIAQAVAPGLGKFRQVGEGYFETMIRVAEGTQRATGELEQLGMTAIDFKDILNKQGDVAAEIARQTLLAQGRLVAGTKDYVGELTGSSEDVIAAYRKLVQAQDLLAAGFNVQNLDRTMINAAGGLDAFVSAMQAFNDSYLSQSQNVTAQLASLSAQFAQFGQTLPDSKDAFLALMQSIDTSTEAGKKLFGGLLQLADGFAKVQEEIDQIRQKYADKLDPMAAIRKTLETVTDDFTTLIAKANSDLREKLIKNGDANLQILLGNKSLATGNLSGANTDLQDARARYDEVWKAIADLNAKGAKITKAERERLGQLTAEAIYLDRQIPILESRQSAAQAALDAAAKAIDDYIKSVADQNRADVLKNAATIMSETLADIMQGLAKTIQEAQQRLDNVLSFQRNLATQIAQLQGSQAIADLANARYGQANNAVNDYIGAVGSGSRARDTEEELRLLGDLQTAVMDRYNAEMALIQEGIQEQTNALNEALQVEIDNINAAAQAQVDAVNATLEAQIDAINAASEAQIKAQQKADAEVLKGIQKQNDLAVKAAQKANDAIIKAQQKVYDGQIKALQKQQDAEVKALQKQQDAALQVWSDQLDAANTLRDAIKGIQEYAKSLLLGPQSTLSPEARLAEAQRQYQELVAKARGGDADALAKLSGSTDAYLEAAKQYYGSGSQYQSIFDGVKTAMEGLGAMSAPDPDSIQSHIDALREAQEAQLDALRESQADAVDALREQQGEQLDALREKLNDQIDLMREQQSEALDVIREAQADAIEAMRESAQDQIESARKAAQDQIDAINKAAQDQIKEAQTRTAQAIADLSDPNKNAAMKALKDETIKKLQEIHDLSEKTRAEAERKAEEARRLAAQQAADAIQIARDQLARLDSGLTFSAAQIRALNGLMAGLNINYQEPVPTTLAGGSGLEGVAGFAGGGYAQAGMALVGEKGPELVRFERPAQVLTAEQTRKALTGDDGKTYQALEAIKGELRAIVTTQSGANPQIIGRLASIEGRLNAMEREQKLANSQGGRRAPA